MRTANDIIWNELELDSDGYESFWRYKEVEKAIKIAQIDAYNEALYDAAENAKTGRKFKSADASHIYFDSEVDKQSILKLKK